MRKILGEDEKLSKIIRKEVMAKDEKRVRRTTSRVV
jgi:hypothetical protein